MALTELGKFDYVEGEIIAGRLRAEGIEAVTFDAGMHLFEGGVRVMVDADDLAAARATLDAPPAA